MAMIQKMRERQKFVHLSQIHHRPRGMMMLGIIFMFCLFMAGQLLKILNLSQAQLHQ